jgi:hypothetical protein
MGTVAALLVGMQGMAGAGAATLGGTATIADPAAALAPLASGGSAKLFSITLPAQAACSGDTQNSGYHVWSFLVHSGTDVTALTFPGGFPSTGAGIFDQTGTYYGPANTAATTGQVINIPNNFQWSQLTAATGLGLSLSTDVLYSGTTGSWDTGLACTDTNGNVTDYWTTPITFTASNTDANGFTWAAVPGVPPNAPEVPLPILLPLIAAAIAAGAIGINRRRRGRLSTAALSTNS